MIYLYSKCIAYPADVVEQNSLQSESVSLLRTVMWGIAGILPISVMLGGLSATAGYASPFVILLALGIILLISVPVLEYTRLAKFAGGYYGAAELGFGKTVGKFVGLSNYVFYLGWQLGNAAFIATVVAVGYYAVYSTYPPAFVYFSAGFLALFVPFLSSILNVKKVSAIVTYMTIIGIVLNIFAIGLLFAHATHFSLNQFNPSYAPGGLHGALFSLVVYGFFTYAGYGFLLFYSEEGKSPFKNTWKAAVIALVISTVISVIVLYAINAVYGSVGILKAIAFPQPGLLLYVRYLGATGELLIVAFLVILFLFSFASGSGSQARLLYTLSRDGFFKNKWIGKLNKNRVPANQLFLSFVIATVLFFVQGAILIPAYGYFSAIFYMAYVPSTIATVFWYFHHLIPDLSLSNFFRKHNIRLSSPRPLVTSIVAPVVATVLIVYSLYESIIADTVEPYFAGVVLSAIVVLGLALWVVFKWHRGTIGRSSVEEMLNTEAIEKMMTK